MSFEVDLPGGKNGGEIGRSDFRQHHELYRPELVKMVKRYRHISHMTHEDVNLLVRLLCLPPTARRYTDGLPSDQWLARQAEKISQLPKTLQRPQDWLARLSIYTNKKLNLTIEDLVPQCAVLCAAHKGLNPWIVHRVFLLISEEVTHRLDPVRKFLENPTKHAVKLKTSLGEVQDYVDRMNSMLSLWTGPDVFSRIVGDNYPPGLAMQRVENDCEACICSCIGAAGQSLCDLRAMMYGRSHRRRPPVLIPLIEAWIERFGEENADRLWAESTRMARDVRHIRRRLMGGNRRHRRHRTPYEKRMKELSRLERDLEGQRLSASQVRTARGQIDKKLDEMFGKDSRKPADQQGKRSSSTASTSTFTASASNASLATTRAKGTRNDRSTPVDDNSNKHQQDDADDAEQLEDYRDEFDETDAAAAYKQQDRLQGWYDAFTEIAGPSGATNVGSQHPAFRQNAAGIESSWAKSQMAMSALPNPLSFSRNVTYREGDEDDDAFVPAAGPARTEVSEWTDASVHTLATQSTHKSRRGGRANTEVAPPVPQLPVQVEGASRAVPSSIYSNNAPTAVHPRPIESDVGTAWPSNQTANRANNRPERPKAATHYPPLSGANSRRRGQPSTVVGSAVTAWPGPGASSGHRRVPSSNREFQAGLDQLGDDEPGFSLPTASLTPDDSVSAVAGVYHSQQHLQEQIDADAALALQMQECEIEDRRQDDESDDEDEDEDGDEDIRTAIANSRETARLDEERRSRASRGGGGQFSDLFMPDSSWL